MEQIPDAPWIRDTENNGIPSPDPIMCPVCGKECEIIYTDLNHDAVGCNECLTLWEPYEWWDRYGEH